jgi:hypothetical protein
MPSPTVNALRKKVREQQYAIIRMEGDHKEEHDRLRRAMDHADRAFENTEALIKANTEQFVASEKAMLDVITEQKLTIQHQQRLLESMNQNIRLILEALS